ncbi:hypothetical protein [Bergeyella zoohelcum]|uniref:Uncharacterized protein n=1 Tax=Bergeyella zoohelcum TaxID=1015 RepID=A0A7Z9CHS3_9FLAO|nr:hypothetical protein [Bergeyella zoohelcum]VDH05845.1 Uncharacterised protein [Bergeyella zoohelcum]
MEIKKAKVLMFDIEEFEIDLDNFASIICRLLPLVDVGESPFTGKLYKGFADIENNCWLVRTEA